MNILVIAEHDHASIRSATRHAVMAAAQIVMFTDTQVHLVVVGSGAALAAQSGAHIAGVAQVIHLACARKTNSQTEDAAAQLLTIASRYSHILVAATPWGSLTAQHLAARLGLTQISEIVSIESADTFGQAAHAGRATATVKSTDGLKVLTVRTGCFEAAPADGGSATVQSLTAVAHGRPGQSAPRAGLCTPDDAPDFCGYWGSLKFEGSAIKRDGLAQHECRH